MFLRVIVTVVLQNLMVNGQVVYTDLGIIKGMQKTNLDGGTIYTFLGIPYAVQPLGNLRFTDPRPKTEPYTGGVFEAIKPTRCVQYMPHLKKVIGQENCLHLNIYTTTLNDKANHDVLVFFHGGGFYYGAGHSQKPDYLLSAHKKLVFVSVNYRLGAFGFLSTDDDVVPGNMGLKDQVVALQWVKKHIGSFGGNPENVVIAGMSAGGVSVHLHYLSPMSRHLFSKGISMSGVALSRLVKTKNIFEDAKNLAKLVNCPTDSSRSMVNCLRASDQSPIEMVELLMAQELPWKDFNSYVHFGPVIEKRSTNPFLDEHPFHILRKGKVKRAPWLVSGATAEGLKPAAFFVDDVEKLKVLSENWNSIAPYLLVFKEFTEEGDLTKVSEQIRQFYLQNENISVKNRKKLIKLIGDRLYMTTIENSVRFHATASRAPVYFYIFDYRGKYSFSTHFSNTNTDLGVSHADDLIYIMKMESFDPLIQSKDENVLNMMLNIWTTFIKSGRPDTGTGIMWSPVSRSITYTGNIDYVKIETPMATWAKTSSDLSERVFWDSLPLDELHISGDFYVPQYIKDMQRRKYVPNKDELKAHTVRSRIQRKNPLTSYFLVKEKSI